MLNMKISKCLQKYKSKRTGIKKLPDKKHFFVDLLTIDNCHLKCIILP